MLLLSFKKEDYITGWWFFVIEIGFQIEVNQGAERVKNRTNSDLGLTL